MHQDSCARWKIGIGEHDNLWCAGHGMFLGNSMPIRDMDVYAAQPQGSGVSSHGAFHP